MWSTTYPASRPAPWMTIDVNEYWKTTPLKYSPGVELTPRYWTGQRFSSSSIAGWIHE